MAKYKKRVIKQLKDEDFKKTHNPKRDILEIMDEIEIEYNVKILYCCLTGSKVYGLEKKDSDYNIRFIFKRPLNDYLTLDEKKNEISYKEFNYECIGWDIDKALKLHYKSNITLYEWLNSTEIYIEDMVNFDSMIDFDKNTLQYSYTKLAKKNYKKAKTDIPYKITEKQMKQYIYTIRYILSWNIIHYEQRKPSLNIYELIDNNKNIPSDILKYIKLFIKSYKKQNYEKIGFIELSNLNAWIYNSIKIMENTNPYHPPRRVTMKYHNIKFQEIIRKSLYP